MLSVEYSEQRQEVAICFDREGLKILMKSLERLGSKPTSDHDHLMVPSWGGHELSEDVQGEGNKLIPHLRLVWRV